MASLVEENLRTQKRPREDPPEIVCKRLGAGGGLRPVPSRKPWTEADGSVPLEIASGPMGHVVSNVHKKFSPPSTVQLAPRSASSAEIPVARAANSAAGGTLKQDVLFSPGLSYQGNSPSQPRQRNAGPVSGGSAKIAKQIVSTHKSTRRHSIATLNGKLDEHSTQKPKGTVRGTKGKKQSAGNQGDELWMEGEEEEEEKLPVSKRARSGKGKEHETGKQKGEAEDCTDEVEDRVISKPQQDKGKAKAKGGAQQQTALEIQAQMAAYAKANPEFVLYSRKNKHNQERDMLLRKDIFDMASNLDVARLRRELINHPTTCTLRGSVGSMYTVATLQDALFSILFRFNSVFCSFDTNILVVVMELLRNKQLQDTIETVFPDDPSKSHDCSLFYVDGVRQDAVVLAIVTDTRPQSTADVAHTHFLGNKLGGSQAGAPQISIFGLDNAYRAQPGVTTLGYHKLLLFNYIERQHRRPTEYEAVEGGLAWTMGAIGYAYDEHMNCVCALRSKQEDITEDDREWMYYRELREGHAHKCIPGVGTYAQLSGGRGMQGWQTLFAHDKTTSGLQEGRDADLSTFETRGGRSMGVDGYFCEGKKEEDGTVLKCSFAPTADQLEHVGDVGTAQMLHNALYPKCSTSNVHSKKASEMALTAHLDDGTKVVLNTGDCANAHLLDSPQRKGAQIVSDRNSIKGTKSADGTRAAIEASGRELLSLCVMQWLKDGDDWALGPPTERFTRSFRIMNGLYQICKVPLPGGGEYASAILGPDRPIEELKEDLVRGLDIGFSAHRIFSFPCNVDTSKMQPDAEPKGRFWIDELVDGAFVGSEEKALPENVVLAKLNFHANTWHIWWPKKGKKLYFGGNVTRDELMPALRAGILSGRKEKVKVYLIS